LRTSLQEDFRQDLARICVPVLVIHGDANRTVPISASGLRTANRINGARLMIVPSTDAEQVNPELVNFLGQKLGARGEAA